MAPFSIPTPCIVPCRMPIFGGPKSIDTNTKIELLCDTELEHEIFYTLDGTKPQPYAGIVQGSKLFKYTSRFYLPAGKITVKAIAIHAKIHSISSNVITKCFEVVKGESKLEKKNSKKKKKKKIVSSDSLNVDNCDALNDIAEETSELINFDEEINNSQKDVSCDISEHSVEDDFIQTNEQYSLNSSATEESIEEDKTICDINETYLLEHSSPLKESKPKSLTRDLLTDQNGFSEEDDLIELEASVSNVKSQPCQKCEINLQQCISCQEMNLIASKYCTYCGEKLKQLCKICNELNLIIASFCQYCGKKLTKEEDENVNQTISDDGRIEIAKKDAFIQYSAITTDKFVQTSPLRINKHLPTNALKQRLPSHSPGRGYWHQQLDFICNHLKTYAYNNIDFRKSISEPALGKFQSAEVITNEDNVTVTITFSPFVREQTENRKVH